MPYPTESATGAALRPGIDFMRHAYELNGEPLRLLEGGQRWFTQLLSHECCNAECDTALVLGATPWLAALIHRTVAWTTVADVSPAMLSLCADTVRVGTKPHCRTGIRFLHGNWLALPDDLRNLDIVASDNGFNFLQYPVDWDQLLEALVDRMKSGAVLLARLLVIPAEHHRLCPAEIVQRNLARLSPVNFTAVRVALLFAHWDSADYTICPENALNTFEKHRSEFDPLLCDVANVHQNDLLSIVKYRGAGATYFVPPLADAIAAFRRHLHVRAVCFGPYEMSEYFPLLVAVKE